MATRDVTFTHNVVAHSTQGINLLGTDDYSKSQVTQNIRIQNNLFDDVAARSKLWGDSGGPPRLFQMLSGLNGGTKDVTIDHAQYEQAGSEIDRLLGNTVARLAFGDSTAKRRSIPDDNQLVHAIDVLKQSTSQKDLFAIAQREQSAASASARR